MNQSKEEFLEKAKEVALKGLPFALFSYPNSTDIHLIYQNDDTLHTADFTKKSRLYHVSFSWGGSSATKGRKPPYHFPTLRREACP